MKTNKMTFVCGYMVLCLLLMLFQNTYAYSGQDSRNGEWHPTKGTIRTLVVFAEVTGDPNYSKSTWPWEAGKLPPDPDKLFDTKLTTFGGGEIVRPAAYGPITPAIPTKPQHKFSRFFYDASFGKLVLLGDYYPELIQIPYEQIKDNGDYNKAVMDVLASKSNLKSKTGLRIPEDFDMWTPASSYQEKNNHNQSNGKIDNLIIIWRVNSILSVVNWSGLSWYGVSSTNQKLDVDYMQYMYNYDFFYTTVVPHEFAHALLGGNNYHTSPANGGRHRFVTDMSGYGLLEAYGCNLRSFNAWDRRRLGWKFDDKLPDIHARSTSGETVNSDVAYRRPSASEWQTNAVPTTQEYVLRDFVTTGDALRVELPYLEQGGGSVEPQWIWLENHAKDTGLVYYPKDNSRVLPLGVRINLQIGMDNVKYVEEYDGYVRANYYVPFSRFGRWDFNVVRSMVTQAPAREIEHLPFIPELDSNRVGMETDLSMLYRAYTTSDKSNAFTGNSLLEKLCFDADMDGVLQDREVFMMRYVYKDNISVGTEWPHMGSAYDAFQVGDELSLATNPATTPWLTHDSKPGKGATNVCSRDNRKIYLNGLKISIKEKRADGSVVVAVTQGYYTVDKSQRWCGDIVLNEKISLNAGRTIRLALGESPIVRRNPIVIDNKRYFTEPTVLTCKSNSVLSLGTNSRIIIDSLCALVLKRGSILEKTGSGGIAVIQVKRGGTLVMEPGVTLKGSGIRLEYEEGAYSCIDLDMAKILPNQGKSAKYGIHPYLQQNKEMYCPPLVLPTKSSKSGGGDAPPVYQSFFDGNPVYYQTWEQYEYKWDGGVTIKEHGLEGDTLVDGVLYHKLKVGSAGWRYHQERSDFWVRESECHDKVWVRLPWDAAGRDILVVDMALKEGDLFPVSTEPDTVYYEVDSVYYQEHEGGRLKHIRLKPTTDNAWTRALETINKDNYPIDGDWQSRHLEFIEGVGSNLGFAYPRLGLFKRVDSLFRPFERNDSLWLPLKGWYKGDNILYLYDYIVCMERGGTSFYTHPDLEMVKCTDAYMLMEYVCYDEWPIDPIIPANESVRSLSRYLRVSPNPAQARVALQWASEAPVAGVCRIELYTLQGVRLRSFTTDSWPYTLHVSDMPHGTYMLRVSPEDASAAWQATARVVVL